MYFTVYELNLFTKDCYEKDLKRISQTYYADEGEAHVCGYKWDTKNPLNAHWVETIVVKDKEDK